MVDKVNFNQLTCLLRVIGSYVLCGLVGVEAIVYGAAHSHIICRVLLLCGPAESFMLAHY